MVRTLLVLGLSVFSLGVAAQQKAPVNALAQESRGGASVAEVRKGFDQRATIDAIDSVKGSDLEVTKDGGAIVVSVTYRKEIPLVSNIGVYIEFKASSKE